MPVCVISISKWGAGRCFALLLLTKLAVVTACINALEVTRKLCETWKVHQGLHRWSTFDDRKFAYLIGHFSKGACNDHWKHHNSDLKSVAAHMRSILDDFIRALPVESCLFSDLCNEMIGKHVSNGCQEQSTFLVLWTPKISLMMIHLKITLKSKHGFAGFFSLWLFSWLNDFSLHLQVKRLMALNMYAKTEISLKKSFLNVNKSCPSWFFGSYWYKKWSGGALLKCSTVFFPNTSLKWAKQVIR